MNFIFLQVGDDPRAALLARSIRKTMPQANIIQCTDAGTNSVEGVDHVFRYDGDAKNLMSFRLESFSELGLDDIGAYLDSDMLLLRPFDAGEALQGADVGLCERVFGKDIIVNIAFKGMDLSEYRGMNFGQVYPYLACLTITRSSEFWLECAQNLKTLPPKFQFWYGDQEAIRNVAGSSTSLKFTRIKESAYACLPEFINDKQLPYLAHFKGKMRKKLMSDYFQKLFG